MSKENINKLEQAELPNPNISIREKQFMSGNRDAYIRSVTAFINGIVIEDDHDSILTFADFFQKRMQQFAKSTGRAYQILQEFLGNESRALALNIKALDTLIKELKQIIVKKHIDKIIALEQEIKAIDQHKYHSVELSKELNQQTKHHQGLSSKKQERETEIKELKTSEEYIQHRGTLELKKKYLDKLEEFNKRISLSFSTLAPALKKYERIAFRDTDIVLEYIKEPVKTLIKDTDFKITEILDHMRKNIVSGTIELKESKKERVLKEIEKLTQYHFEDFITEIGNVRDKILELNEDLDKSEIPNKLKKLDEEVKNIAYDAEKAKSSIVHATQELSKIDFEKLKRKFEKEIKELLKTEITIS